MDKEPSIVYALWLARVRKKACSVFTLKTFNTFSFYLILLIICDGQWFTLSIIYGRLIKWTKYNAIE